MNKKLMAVILTATTLGSVSAFADQYDHNDRNQSDRGQQNYDHDRDSHNNSQHQNNGNNGQHQKNQPRYMQSHQAYRHDMPRPHSDWRKGQKLPAQYRSQSYYVNDWRNRDLPSPPSGHHWLNVNGDYVLVAAATGIISSILLGGH